METRRIYLDTHLLLWLYSTQFERLTQKTTKLLDQNDLFISPMVMMELQFLEESKKTSLPPKTIFDALSYEIGLQISNFDFEKIIQAALKLSWTRDPFDRMIVAEASLNKSLLITKDRTILKNYKQAVW